MPSFKPLTQAKEERFQVTFQEFIAALAAHLNISNDQALSLYNAVQARSRRLKPKKKGFR